MDSWTTIIMKISFWRWKIWNFLIFFLSVNEFFFGEIRNHQAITIISCLFSEDISKKPRNLNANDWNLHERLLAFSSISCLILTVSWYYWKNEDFLGATYRFHFFLLFLSIAIKNIIKENDELINGNRGWCRKLSLWNRVISWQQMSVFLSGKGAVDTRLIVWWRGQAFGNCLVIFCNRNAAWPKGL